ncbi:MAG: glycoside hydrolase family 127 protein [Alistipes sp.]|nr:glycoside hydrolase family 127 protein [Alistipes sp.]
MRLWATTGEGDYLQHAERIFYNSVAPAQREDGRFTCLLSDTLDGKLSRYPGDVYGVTTPWVEALPAAVDLSYYIAGNKILIPFYAEGELILPEAGIKLVQHTLYPADSTIRLTVEQAPKRGIGLWLYFPSYMTARSISRNGGQPLSGTVNSVGLLEMKEVYRKGDIIDFDFRFGPKWVETTSEDISDSNLYKASCGPLLLGYRADGMLWLERGVPLRSAGSGFRLDPELSYAKDTLSGRVLINPSGPAVQMTPPMFETIYQPLGMYGGTDILPEYFLVRIGKD